MRCQGMGAATLVPIVAIAGLAYTYKTMGADELRTRVYQPLFSDVVSLEEAVQTVSVEKPPHIKALPELKQTGALVRVPNELRRRVLQISEETSRWHGAVGVVRELALREISSRIIGIRTEQIDRIWHEKAVNTLHELSRSKKGMADSAGFSIRHEGRSPGIDIRDPTNPVIASPGGPAFVVRDWVTYPESLGTIEELWKDLDYLYFNETVDAWYYQLTREDLN